MIKCGSCGQDVKEGSKFCTNCGAKFVAPAGQSYVVQQKDNGEMFGLAIAAFCCSFIFRIVGLVLGAIALNANKGKSNIAKNFSIAAVAISSAILVLEVIYIIFVASVFSNILHFY